jgi:hypothetical protein
MLTPNDSVVWIWNLADVAGGPFTGLEATMTVTLRYSEDGSAASTASETATVSEIGSTGLYAVTFTAASAGFYTAHVVESNTGLEATFDQYVEAEATTSSEDNCYCALDDVEAYAQMGAYDASSKPTQSHVLGFMENRAGELYGIVRSIAGSGAPGPSGYSSAISTDTDQGYALGRALRGANAMMAAADALEAAGAGESPSRSERISTLMGMAEDRIEVIKGLARDYVRSSGSAKTHLDQVDGWAPDDDVSDPEEAGLDITMETDW